MKLKLSRNRKYRTINKWEEYKMKKKVMIALAALAVTGAAVTGCVYLANAKVYGYARYR